MHNFSDYSKLTISYRVNSGENIGTYACVLMRLTAPKVNSTITCTGAGTTAGNATLDSLSMLIYSNKNFISLNMC